MTRISSFGEFSVEFSEPVSYDSDLESMVSLAISPYKNWNLQQGGFNQSRLWFTWHYTGKPDLDPGFLLGWTPQGPTSHKPEGE